jgi:hypothetical protein
VENVLPRAGTLRAFLRGSMSYRLLDHSHYEALTQWIRSERRKHRTAAITVGGGGGTAYAVKGGERETLPSLIGEVLDAVWRP